MRDYSYIVRDPIGRFASTGSGGSDSRRNSATSPGGSRTNVPSKPENAPSSHVQKMDLETAETWKSGMTRMLQNGKVSPEQRESFDREYKQVQDHIMELRSAELSKSKSQRAADNREKRAREAEARRKLAEAGIGSPADMAAARKEGDMLAEAISNKNRQQAQEKAIIDALKGDGTKTPQHLGGQPKATRADAVTRNEISYRMSDNGTHGEFADSGEVTSTIRRLMDNGTIKQAPSGGMYLGRAPKAKPDALRTASGTVLNSGATINSTTQPGGTSTSLPRYSW